jgi:NADPH:quinone reductase-like Zn-dependent oxidoreductase
MVKAIVYDRYGSPDVLRFEDVDTPQVEADQVLVRIVAAAPNPWDWHFMRGEPYLVRLLSGLRRPKRQTIPGSDVAGVIEAVGERVSGFDVGDEVYGFVGFGGFAELLAVDATKVAPKPAGISFEEAAGVPLAALTALQGLRDHGRIEAGQKVLVNGAAGGVGTFAVQIAGALGAEVTGVCGTRNVDMVRSIGAARVVDYMREDAFDTDQRYDLVLDNVGNHDEAAWRRVMTPGGVFVPVSGRQPISNWLVPVPHGLKRLWTTMLGRPVAGFTVKRNGDDLRYLTELIETGLITTVVDKTYTLDGVAAAMTELEGGHVRGKLVVTI